MKVNYKVLGTLFFILVTLVECKKDEPAAPLAITLVDPMSGPVGHSVTINGTGFRPGATQVSFNGANAMVLAITTTQLTVDVPSDATTGKITVIVGGQSVSSATDFTVTPTITSFTPTSGAIAASVTVTGTGFSSNIDDNAVKFNGIAAAVLNATSTQITTNVPEGATTGKITITVNGSEAVSATDFTILPTPTIASFTPAYYLSGSALPDVIINGTNFSATIGENTVKFNGATANIKAATSTQLTATLPADATSGKITVTVNGVTGTSSNDFLIGCPDLIISNMAISNISVNNFTVTYDIKNIGTIPMQMHTMFIQSYVSTNGSLHSVATGGFTDYGPGEPDLGPNETRQKTQDISSSVSIATYPYVIFDLLTSAGSSPECHTDNNEAYKKIQ